jgi:hypothetical protein
VRFCGVWFLLALALSGCAEPKFEFRGYTDLSGCTDVVDAELASGSSYVGVYNADDPQDLAQTIELSGTIFSEPVRINVSCTRGRVDSIQYVAQESDPKKTGPVFAAFAAGLDGLFGEPTVLVSDNSRSLRYLCDTRPPVLLEEWRLEPVDPDEDDEPVHEVYLAVVPAAAECLTRERSPRSR